MDSLSEDDLCWLQLDDFRMLLIKNIEPSRITPYLRQCQVISAEDEEQLFNDPSLVIRRRKVGSLLDLLQRTGVKGYTAFLESLELDYPELYKRITGKEPNKKFSILIDTAGESGLTSFLMAELSRLQRALQEEKRRRQQACCVAKQQEAWSRQQQLRERELKKLTERAQKLQEERERSSEEVKRLREHNYNLMEQINTLNQDRSDALLNNRDLQIQVERLKLTVLRAERQTRRLRRHPLRPLQESRSLTLQSETFQLNQLQEQMEEKQEEENQEQERLMEKQEEDQKEEKLKELKQQQSRPQRSLLASLFRLRTELHRAEEQRARSVEEKEELELRCTQLKGDAKMYRQQNKQTLRQLEEVIRERDKAMASQAERQEEARQLLQEKDQYREQVRQLTEHSDRLELSLLRSKGEELQLRTRLRRITCNSSRCNRSESSDEEEQLTEKVPEVSCVEEHSASSEEVHSEEVHSEEVHSEEVHSEEVHGLGSPLERSSESERRASNAASWDGQADVGLRSRPNFLYRRIRAMRSKVISAEPHACNHDDSSCSDITVSE